jgi:GT2 family glycosyltransferase
VKQPRILFVVPSFNRAHDLPRTLAAIAAQRHAADLAILVVDNASTDHTAAVMAELARTLPVPVTHHVKAPEGPTVARNLGLARGLEAEGPAALVALVDSDVELAPGWLAAALDAMTQDARLAQVAGPLVYAHARDTLNSYGGETGPLGLCWDRLEGAPLTQAASPCEVGWINTAAVLMRAGPVLEAGGFDTSFFYGYEEPDLGLRLARRGWRSRVVPGALAIHHVGAAVTRSHPDIVFHYTKNRLRMGLKNFAPAHLLWWVPVSLAYGLLDAALHQPRMARLRALGHTLADLPALWSARRQARGGPALGSARFASRWFPPTRLHAQRRRGGAGEAATADDRVPLA